MKTSHLPLPSGSVFFVTMCLRHALPESFGLNLGLQFYTAQTRLSPHPDRLQRLHQVRKQLFSRYDHALDLEKYHPGYFREPLLAQTLAEEIQRQDGCGFELLAYSILPNHVHFMIVLPDADSSPDASPELLWMTGPIRNWVLQIQIATEAPLQKALHQAGSLTHDNIFQIQNRQGMVRPEGPCWEAQSFNFLIQDATEFNNALHYIRSNPVKAGFSDWPFTYSNRVGGER